ncbi:hypothetical protein DIE17_14110 [Burkholderia sp. Bp9099]|nr:hypothetical protein DIE17_14110 [Burkholderia sp. Bp9099]
MLRAFAQARMRPASFPREKDEETGHAVTFFLILLQRRRASASGRDNLSSGTSPAYESASRTEAGAFMSSRRMRDAADRPTTLSMQSTAGDAR